MRARESKAAKEVEALAASVARLEALRAAADAELAQQRRMLEEAGARAGWGGGQGVRMGC